MTDEVAVMSAEEAEAAEWAMHGKAVEALVDALFKSVTQHGFPPAAAVDGAVISAWLTLRGLGMEHDAIADHLRTLIDAFEADPPEVRGAGAARGKRRRADA